MASAEIYNKALDLLSRREHSRKELFLKLINRFESQEEINLTLDKLVLPALMTKSIILSKNRQLYLFIAKTKF